MALKPAGCGTAPVDVLIMMIRTGAADAEQSV